MCLAPTFAADKPNVLIFLVDDLGYADLGAYGSEISTPNINALAQTGVQFKNFYVEPRCSPTRAALLTGQQNQNVGFSVLADSNTRLTRNNVMLPELLKSQGYDTYLSGKWHLGATDNFGTKGAIAGDAASDPRVRGFDSAFTYINGGDHSENAWDPSRYRLLSSQVSPINYTTSSGSTAYTKGSTFYQTDAITDYALKFINNTRTANAANGTDRPFFEYVAYGAPHFPLQAPKTLVDQYVAKYSAGWDAIRADRLQAMIAKGIVDPDVVLTPRSDVPDTGHGEALHQVRAWNTIPADRQADLVRRMAIYAAMVDTVDQGVGKIVNDLKAHGELDNTLVMFMSDNGGDGEWHEYGAQANATLHTGSQLDVMGTNADTLGDVFYGTGWANVSDTPYQQNKHYTGEGGIRSPLIVNWGNGVNASLKGTMTDQVMQVNDVMPTMLSLMGIDMPSNWTALNGTSYAVKPFDSTSTSMYDFLTTGNEVGSRELAWEHEGNRAYRSGDWKLMSTNFAQTDGVAANQWQLFDLSKDPTETQDVAAQNPHLYNQLVSRWAHWAYRNNVLSASAAVPTAAPLAIVADNGTLFLDHFGRANNNNLDASTTGISGSLSGSLGVNSTWVEAFEGSGQSSSIRVNNGSLQMAVGLGMSNAYLNHNFTDNLILQNGGMTVRIMVTAINSTSDGSDPNNRFAGFGLGMTQSQANTAGDINTSATSYRGAVGRTSNGVADFFIDLDIDGTLRVWNDGAVVASTETGLAYGEIGVTFRMSSFSAGSAVSYDVFLDGLLVDGLSGSFRWDQSNSNYLGLSGRASDYVTIDNLQINVPEPVSGASPIAAAGIVLSGRAYRRRGRM